MFAGCCLTIFVSPASWLYTIMLTAKFKIPNQDDIAISWSIPEQLKEVICVQTSNFGKEHDLTFDEIKSKIEYDYQIIVDFVLDNVQFPSNPTIVDIGSGTSIVDLVLYKYLQGRANFYLVDNDRLHIESGGHPEFLHHRDFKPFNKWEPVLDAIVTNSFDKAKFTFIDPSDNWKSFKQADIILSNSSYGLHYPLDVYLDRINSTLKPGGYLILRPLLNINEPVAKLNSLYGEPICLNETPMDQIKIHRPNDYEEWKKVFPNWETMKTWGYRGVWQKPYN